MDYWNNNGGPVEQIWWKSGTMMVEQWNRYRGNVEQWNRDGRPVEKLWWNRGTNMVEQWNNGGTEKQR